MKYRELVDRVTRLPNVGTSFCPYVIQWSFDGPPTTAMYTLIPHSDGTFTASEGDLREKTEPVLDADGSVRIFRNEDAACEWAWGAIRAARIPPPGYTAEQTERALKSAAEQHRRYAELDRQARSGPQQQD